MNAVSFLINEHNQFRKEFKEISDSSHHAETKLKMFVSLCEDLLRHETMEQKLWYPILKEKKELSDIIKHLISEEKDAGKLIEEFEKIKTVEEWEKKFLELKKAVEHHAEEEETKLFPKAKKILSEEELQEIGKAMHDFKASVEDALNHRRAA